MKKMLIIGAAAFCATVTFGIESQVVGYNAGAMAPGVKFYGNSFVKVSGAEAMTFADLKINCDENGEGGWDFSGDCIVMLTNDGSFDKKIYYIPQVMADEFEGTKEAGWYPEDEYNAENLQTKYDSTELNFGMAVQFMTGGDGVLTSAGEVKGAPTATELDSGVASVANCAPKATTLGGFVVNCDENGEGGWDFSGDCVVLLTNDGSFDKKIYYIPQVMADELEGTHEAGWYPEDEYNEENLKTKYDNLVEVAVGEGLQFMTGGSAVVTIKSALAVAE